MTADAIHSFLFDRASAADGYPGIGPRELLLAVLASVPPEAAFEGCDVYLGAPPDDESVSACVGLRGPGSEALQEALVTAFERAGIAVTALYECGPEIRERVARASGGRWASA